MCLFCRDFRKILHIVIFSNSDLKITDDILIFFFEHLSINTIHWLTSCIILFVLGDLIDKEKRKNFYAFIEQFSFSLNMRKDCLSNLNAAKLIFRHLTDYISRI